MQFSFLKEEVDTDERTLEAGIVIRYCGKVQLGGVRNRSVGGEESLLCEDNVFELSGLRSALRRSAA